MSLADTLVDLIATGSVTGQEGRLCTAVAERLLPTHGFNGVHRIGNSLIVGKRTDKPLITLYGHLDTVPEQDGNATPRRDGTLIHGLGASDMKAGLAVMIHLLEDTEVAGGPFDLVGVFYDKEEGPMADNGLEDVLTGAEWLEDAEFAVVMEPTDLELQLGCNGAMNASVVFSGSAAHSARPWLGENAITKAGSWLQRLHAVEPVRVDIAGLEFREVFSVTRANGGIANNVIPPEFVINLNYRFPPLYSDAQAETRLREMAQGADAVTIEDRAPAGAIDVDNQHFARLERVSGAVRTAKQGWTDVARLTSRGVSAVNYGPGIVAQAHQASEHVPIQHLEDAYAAMRSFLLET